MEGIKINKRPKLKNPYLIVAWPGMGEVAYKAAVYLVEQLRAQEFASIDAQDYFYLTGSIIRGGILDLPELPQSKFYFWKNPAAKSGGHDLVIFVSNAQPDLNKAKEYSKEILQVAKALKVETVICFASMPQPIDHTQEPGVWVVATAKELTENFKKLNFNILLEGQISGMNGLFLGLAKNSGFNGFCILGEVPLYTIQIENPRASVAVLAALSRVLNIRIDFSGLIGQAHIMEGEINKLIDYLKLGTAAQAGPIGEEEIERIKKSLGQLTKLPVSMKERIEKLFEQAVIDITKATELKKELDKWNVYKEYEDRFLDLFKKVKDKGN